MRRNELEQLIRTHQQAIYRYLRYLGAEAALADDLVQETFLAAARKVGVFTDEGRSRAVLRGMARNLFLTECRRDRRRAQLASELADLPVDAEAMRLLDDGEAWAERIQALRECVQGLPEQQAAIIRDRYVNGASREEMAQRTGLSEDGIKSSLRRIRAVLAKCVESKLEVRRR